MKGCYRSIWIVMLLLISPSVFSYGSGGGGGSSCNDPQFSDEAPKNESTVGRLERFLVDASANTDMSSLQLDIDGARQDPKVTSLPNGDFRLEVVLKEARVSPSKVRITIRARSDGGCETFQPYYIHVKP